MTLRGGVGAHQPHRTVAVPVPQRQVLVLGLPVRPAELEHRRLPSPSRTGTTTATKPCACGTVDGQRPLGDDVAQQPGSASIQRRQSSPRAAYARNAGGISIGNCYFLGGALSVVDRAAMNASWGTSTRPTIFIRFLPSFCFSSSLRLRVMSPP